MNMMMLRSRFGIWLPGGEGHGGSIWPQHSIDDVLQRYRGIGPGFDFLRIGLAVCIVAWHCVLNLGYGDAMRVTPLWYAEYALVPMFFALSGFLVTGSATRLSLKNFLINRGLRILPALAVDITVCALIIGPLVTTLPLSEYYTHADFFRYFLNITGWIHYSLPGVFKDLPSQRVNGALWTVPFEVFCYILMSVLIVTRWVRSPRSVAGLTLALLTVITAVKLAGRLLPPSAQSVAEFIFVSDGTRLLISFLLGILVYQMKNRVPYSWKLFLLCCALCLAAAVGHKSTLPTRVLSNAYILLPAVVYITCFLGVTRIPVPKFVHSGDYSYGIYLYHDPLLQVILGLFPGLLALHIALGAPMLLLMGLPAVGLLATFSWHFIEKPILGLRKRFSFVARMRGVASGADASVAPPMPAGPTAHDMAAPDTAAPDGAGLPLPNPGR